MYLQGRNWIACYFFLSENILTQFLCKEFQIKECLKFIFLQAVVNMRPLIRREISCSLRMSGLELKIKAVSIGCTSFCLVHCLLHPLDFFLPFLLNLKMGKFNLITRSCFNIISFGSESFEKS